MEQRDPGQESNPDPLQSLGTWVVRATNQAKRHPQCFKYLTCKFLFCLFDLHFIYIIYIWYLLSLFFIGFTKSLVTDCNGLVCCIIINVKIIIFVSKNNEPLLFQNFKLIWGQFWPQQLSQCWQSVLVIFFFFFFFLSPKHFTIKSNCSMIEFILIAHSNYLWLYCNPFSYLLS